MVMMVMVVVMRMTTASAAAANTLDDVLFRRPHCAPKHQHHSYYGRNGQKRHLTFHRLLPFSLLAN
jgi:hypothetical protein